ncbi:MAG: 1-phosphofructokinase family hexose kinase [Oscillospiraceae bacterium]|jgi:tagatose 6-phosphate kinase|nr:1-phosphofructokinase family hexose kinase [Oscillospiraceae bacterium]
MLLTVTLNPAIDKRYVLGALRPGEVLRVRECVAGAGGKGLNVARAAAIAGEDVLATGICGGFAGQLLEAELRKEGIPSCFLRCEAETRSCINIYDEAKDEQTELLEPGAAITDAIWQGFLALYTDLLKKATVVTLSGSLPKNAPTDAYATLVKAARTAGKPAILDTSGAALQEGLQSSPTLIKPNIDEIAQRSAEDDPIPAAIALRAQGAENVAISLGAEGALLATPAGVWRGKPPKIQAVNTVGCGDSMVAAFALSLARGYSAPKMLQTAIALSCASAVHPRTGAYDPAIMEQIYPRCGIEKIV